MVTQLLEKAFREAAKLPEAKQEALATAILDDIAAERNWDKAFSASRNELSTLADEALAEHRRGETQSLDAEKA